MWMEWLNQITLMHSLFNFTSKSVIVAVKSPFVPNALLLQSFRLRFYCILRRFHSNFINAAPLQHICEGRVSSPIVWMDSCGSVCTTIILLIQDETRRRQESTNLVSFLLFLFVLLLLFFPATVFFLLFVANCPCTWCQGDRWFTSAQAGFIFPLELRGLRAAPCGGDLMRRVDGPRLTVTDNWC